MSATETADERYARLCAEADQALADLNALKLPVEPDVLFATVSRAYRTNAAARAFWRAVISRPVGRPN
jgi:hypothetical protein